MRWLSAWYARAFTYLVAAFAGSSGGVAQDDPDTAAWQRARAIDTYEAYQRYLEEFPIGRYASEAFRSMVEEALDQELGAEVGGRASELY